MKIFTAQSAAVGTAAAVAEAIEALRTKGCAAPELVICAATVAHDFDAARDALRAAYPDAQLQGGSSCGGVMTDCGHCGADGAALGLFAIEDPNGCFGAGSALIDDPFEAGADAIRQALIAAGRPGERPEAVWLMAAPGHEEQVLMGVESVVGGDVPLIGGSSADNTLEGRWRQFDNGGVYSNAVTVAALFPSKHVSASFHSGYDASARTGVVTAVEGRTILAIDGRPAAEVYNEWTDGAISDVLPTGGPVLGPSNLFPLGRRIADVGGEPYFVLSHPERVTPHGGVAVFTDVAVGDELVCMKGDVVNLRDRAGRVAAAAREAEGFEPNDIVGSLVIFCAGCMLTLADEIHAARAKISAELGPETPFLGAYTFGEQGYMADGRNRHGNLMISVMHFGEKPR